MPHFLPWQSCKAGYRLSYYRAELLTVAADKKSSPASAKAWPLRKLQISIVCSNCVLDLVARYRRTLVEQIVKPSI